MSSFSHISIAPAHPPAPQVKAFKEHKARITDLSFDESTEALASCASDGSVVVRRVAVGERVYQ